jgi:hypothetical protein
MNKSDIKNGMHVITKDGSEYVVISDVYAPCQIADENTAKVAMLGLHGGWMNLDQYDEESLCFRDKPSYIKEDDWQYDIEEVYAPKYYSYTFESVKSKTKNDFIRLWKRGVKKITKEEIEAILGYEIEIVD